jgi:hypothetical protein
MSPEQKPASQPRAKARGAGEKAGGPGRKTKFESYGEEMIEKEVKKSGRFGRIYLPPEWVGKNVKIIRIN